jgi:hypothetical protein
MTAAPDVTITDVSTLTADNVSVRPCAQCASRTLLSPEIGRRSRDLRRTGSELRRLGRSGT